MYDFSVFWVVIFSTQTSLNACNFLVTYIIAFFIPQSMNQTDQKTEPTFIWL